MSEKFNSNEYINKYQKENYDRITILRKQGEKKRLNDIALKQGYSSLSAFINSCIDNYIDNM